MKEEYLKEAREILEDIHYQWSEPKPGTFKGMVQSLAEWLKKRDARQSNEWVRKLRNRINDLEILGAGISKSQLEEFGELVTEIKENILDLLPEPPKE